MQKRQISFLAEMPQDRSLEDMALKRILSGWAGREPVVTRGSRAVDPQAVAEGSGNRGWMP